VTSDQIIFWFSKKNNTNNTNINDYDWWKLGKENTITQSTF
jgi:hypothetical protein